MRRALWLLAVAAIIATAALALYWPALRFELMGDDYQWVQHAHRAMHRPALLLADLDTFYRPASTWTLVADRALWGHRPLGYHLTNVLLHAAVGLALAVVGRRLGLPWLAASTVALLWVVSPFAEEPAVSVAIRFEDLLLLAWLGLACAWPRGEETWSHRRLLAVAFCSFLALMSKETWVVTPALVWVLERFQHRAGSRRAWRTGLIYGALAVVYIAVYFAFLPGGKNYYQLSFAPLAKLPHQLAAFCYLEGLVPVAFPLSWRGVLATAVVVALAVFTLRRAAPAAGVGLGLLLLPTLPTLLVPYLPTRYTAIPYAGFLLLLAAGYLAAERELSHPVRTVARAGTSLLVVAVGGAGFATVRADLADLTRVSAWHAHLLAEARDVAAELPTGRPVAVVRGEAANPLLDIALSVRGLPKLFFVRQADPYGLIDAAALFEWVLGREDTFVRRYDAAVDTFAATPGAVLLHREGGFDWQAQVAPDIGALASELQTRRVRFDVIRREAAP